MRRIISLLLCATMILGTLPAYVFAAPELDFGVEDAKEAVTNEDEAVLAATVPDYIPVYDSELGELVYLEDFEDGSTGNGFSNGSNAYIYTSMTVGDDPAGEGDKAALNTASIMTAQVDKPSVTHYDEVTVMAEVYVPASLGSAGGWCRVAFNDAKCDWSTYSISETDKWITVSETVTDIDVHSSGSWVYELSGKNVYFDNYRVYAKYDITGKVRLVDGNTVKTVDAAEGLVAEKPESAGNNAWEGEDGTVYMAGDKIPAGTTVIATKVAEPIAPYDKNLGELVYLEDFEDGSTGNAFSNGSSAYIYTSMTVVDDPAGEGDKAALNTASIMTAQVDNPSVTHYDEVTVMAEVYVPTSLGSAGGWCRVAFNDAKCDWSTYNITETDKWITVSETVKDIDVHSSGSWIYELSGKNVYFDNYRVYAKYDLGTKVRLIEGYTLTHVEGGSKAPTPENDKYNAWENEAGKIYAPGDTLIAGETLTAVYADLEETPDEPEEEEVYSIPVYSEELGELVYLEDFEDGSQGNSYTTLGNNAYIWTTGNIVNNPKGDGKAFISTSSNGYTQLMLNGDYSVKGTEVTFMVDFLNYDGVTTNIPVCFMDEWLDPWNYWTNNQISKTEWTTKSVTKTIDANLTNANMRFYFGGKGMHTDNVRIYAKYELVDKVRFVDGNTLKHLGSASGCVAPAPVTAGKTAWRGDNGVIYYEGDTIPAGTTVTACNMPATYDFEMGQLIYFEDFSDGTWDNGYTTGKNAYFYQNGGVEEGKKYGTGMYPSILEIVDGGVGKANSITLKMDVKKTADSTATGVAIWGNGFEAWPAFSVEDVTADAWTTKTKTFNNVTLNATGVTQYCFGFAGLYVDNICIYADADIGNSIRLIDAETKIIELDGDSYTFPAFESAQKNVWVDKNGNQYTAGQTVASSEIAGKTFKSDLVKFDEIVKLNVSANEITTDKGEITITPEIRYVTGETVTDFSGVQYVTDTANASVEVNDDGSATVTGQINGDVKVTVLLPEEITENLESDVTSLEADIAISGQSDRIVGTTFKVMMFGNSIRAHGPSESLGWPGNWGMAASSEDKDYAHRFIHYMEEKYGEGTAELVEGHTPAGFEVAAASCTEYNEVDFVSYVSGFQSYVLKNRPDIVTLQLGENGSEGVKAEIYAKVMAQVIRGIKEVAPDAIIVISAPFWSAETSGKVVGTYAAAEECGIEVAPVYTLGQGPWDGSNPNMAFGASWVTDKTSGGVKAHPGDEGMDNIAKLFFEKVNISLSTSDLIEYTTIPESIEIIGDNLAITEEEGTLELSAAVLPSDASQLVVWSLVSENAESYASINEDGVLTAINNGTVTVRATSRYNDEAYAEAVVTISGQTDPFTVTYDGNAEDAVVPEPYTMAKKGFRLDNPEYFASRPEYKFLGWSLEKDGEVIDALYDTESDVTVYAVWEIADNWDFERANYAEDFTFENAFHQKVTDGKLSVTATGTDVGTILSVFSPKLKLLADDYSYLRINMQVTEKNDTSKVKLVVVSGGDTKEYSLDVTSTDYTDYYFDLSGLNGSITGFTLFPASKDCAVNIDEIKFIRNGEAEYAKKPAEYSDTYGNLVYFDNFSGEDFGNTADVIILGPGSAVNDVAGRKAKSTNSNSLGDTVLSGILVKAADGETFKYTDGRVMDGTLTLLFDMYNGTEKTYSYTFVVDKNPGGWDSWAGMYTAWNGSKALPGVWMTHVASTSASGKGVFGRFNSHGIGSSVSYASVALYFKPTKAVTLVDGDNVTVIDVNGLDTVTLPEPKDSAFTGWKSGSTVYAALDTVKASDLEGLTLSACEANTGKITYYGVSYEYLLIDGNSKSYDVKNDNYPEWDISLDGTVRKCIGWSTEENDDTAVATIDVTTDGVILYPVWEIIAEAIDYEIALVGVNAIELDNVDRTYTYEAVFTPDIEYNTVTWSVSDESVATIDENGVLTPVKSGNITVTAKADYYPGKTASIDVAVTYKEGYEPISVSFEGDVKALPEGFEIIPGKTIDLGEYLEMTPNNSAKRFNGWILNGDTSVIYTGETEALSGEDMVFTALTNYDFNFAVPQTVKGYYNHGKWEQKDDMLVCIPNGSGQDNFVSISGLSIPASRFEAVEYYMDINYTQNGEVKQFKENHKGMEFYFSTDSVSNKYHSADVVGFTDDGKYAIIRTGIFDDKWSGTVKAIRNDFLGNDYNFGYNIRYVRFIEKPQMAETVLTIEGIDSPVTGFAPDVAAAVTEKYAGIDSVTWSCGTNDSFLASGNFNENTVYTVTVKVSCTDEDEIFNDVVTATLNGKAADISVASDGAILVSYTFEATDAFLEYDAEISGKDVITRAGRSVAYKFVVSNTEVPDKTATWSIDNTDIAVMTADGKLVAKKNGTLTITAVSNYNPDVSVTYDVTIEGLEEKYIALTFDKGTTDEVTGMPENVSVQAGKIALPEEVPAREGYIFLGWTEGEDSFEVIESLTADKDVTLVALWGTGVIWNFNNSKDGFAVDCGTLTVSDTYVIASTAGMTDIRLYSPKTDLDPARYNTFVVRLATERADKADLFYSPDNAGISAGRMLSVNYTSDSLDTWHTLTFDFSSTGQYTSAQKITKFWFDPFDATNTTAYIDYIAVLDNYRTITFDANGGTLPEAYANGLTKKTGTKLSLTEEASLEGSSFLGWSRTPDGEKLVTTLTVRDNTTLYAIYGEKVDSDTESIVLDSDEVLLVKAETNTSISISYITPDGERTWNGTTNMNGYAIAELETGVELTEFVINPANAEVVVSKKSNAEETANAVPADSNTTIKVDGVPVNGEDNSGPKKYDYTVEELTKPGTIFPEGNSNEISVAVDFAKGLPVVFGFDEDYEKNLFSEVVALERGNEPESVLSYRIFSKNSGAAVNTEMKLTGLALDAEETKYIVIRARALGFENPTLRLYFTDNDTASYTKLASVFHTISDEYAVYVYNMSANKHWNGTVNSIKLASENNTGGSLDFDWIMFTNEIPEDTTELDKAYDIFEAVVREDMPFTDLAKNKWSYKEIAQSYKRGFVKGVSETLYAPDASVTLAEAITIAVRLNHIFHGKEEIGNAETGNWYDTYVAAAISAKIIKPNQFDDYNRAATRREVAMIMEAALPSYYLQTINLFDSIPDVEEGSAGEKAILTLYSAGVLTGNDAKFSFLPENNITREEIAAIVNRLALPSARKRMYTELERIANRKVYEGAALNGMSLWTCTEDYLKVGADGIGRTKSAGTDPIVLLHTVTGTFNGKDVQKIRMGIVWDKENVKLTPQLYYATVSSPGYAWQRMFEGKIGETDENGVTEVVFDVTTQSAFQDTVKELRFDPFDLADTEFGIAYIILE